MAKSIYKVQTWRSGRVPGKYRYHHHLVCTVPVENIMHSAVHSSRHGRSAAVKRLKLAYRSLVVESLRSKPTIK